MPPGASNPRKQMSDRGVQSRVFFDRMAMRRLVWHRSLSIRRSFRWGTSWSGDTSDLIYSWTIFATAGLFWSSTEYRSPCTVVWQRKACEGFSLARTWSMEFLEKARSDTWGVWIIWLLGDEFATNNGKHYERRWRGVDTLWYFMGRGRYWNLHREFW